MIKKSYLTPILSGVLAVSIVGTGAFYFINKSNDDGKSKKLSGGKTSITEISDNVTNTLSKAQQAAKGELEFGYDANVEVKFSEEAVSELGYDFKPFNMTTSTKQKGQMTSVDIGMKYEDDTLLTINGVVNNSDGLTYIKIPELSDAYVYGTEEQIASLSEDESDAYSSYGSGDTTAMLAGMATSTQLNGEAFKAFEDADYDALFDDLASYVDLIKEKIPEGVEKDEKFTGDIDGNEYEYTTKEYEITGQNAYDMIIAISEKAKTDEVLKNLIIDSGLTEEEYNSSIDEMIAMETPEQDELDEIIFNVDVYYDGDVATGYSFDLDGVKCKMITIETEEVTAIDMAVDGDNVTGLTVKGSSTLEDNKINGKYKMVIQDEYSGDISVEYVLTDLEAVGETFTGTMLLNFVDSDNTAASFKIVSNSTEEEMDLAISIIDDGAELMTTRIIGKETDASDITVPTGELFEMTDSGIEGYLATCDTEGFMANLENGLGSELYNALISSQSAVGYDDELEYDSDIYDDFEDEDYEDIDDLLGNN